MAEQIPRTHIEIWRTDANGKIGKQTTSKNKYRMTRGDKNKKTNRTRRRKLLNICETQNAIPMNTMGGHNLQNKKDATK